MSHTVEKERKDRFLDVARAEWAKSPETCHLGVESQVEHIIDGLSYTLKNYKECRNLAGVENGLERAVRDLENKLDKVRALRRAQAEVNGWV